MISLVLSRFAHNVTVALDAVRRQFYAFFSVIQEAHATAARSESLAQMSDAELARHGLKREGLAQAVFEVAQA
jgi:hypothetical protein